MEEGDRTGVSVAFNRTHEETDIMNIGTVKRNMNGQLIGQITTIALSLTIGLRPVTSNNPKAPRFEIVALNAARQWTNVGALFELTMTASGESFYQGKIDDPSMAQPLYIALFAKGEGEYAVAWQRPRRRSTEIGASEYREADMFEGEAAEADTGDGLGESTAKPPRGRKGSDKTHEIGRAHV